ncbi:T9SS type A sorting domain-containing protein [Rufibacter radiotolerans]|uniref:T9SS type A sorting domain-containing protein n=1 Tax=Rufibacter radiotolerans TaxID=1379910 RepID=UPI0018CE526B|nr:T9SS type A sorting domain-containing protein [Rufibacter radiotolerans]
MIPLSAAFAQETCLLIPLSLEERVQTSEAVVEGKVISQRSFWDDKHENIYTAHQVEVYKVFKGTPSGSQVEIITEGGRVDMDLHVYSATLQLKIQQQGVFFLQKSKTKNARYAVVGSMQGFIKYDLGQGTARDPFQKYASIPLEVYGSLTRLSGAAMRTVKANPELAEALAPKKAPTNQRRLIPLITGFSPLSLRAGTGDVLTITGTNFGTTRGSGYVEFRDADDGGTSFIKPLDTDYVSWSDNEIKVKVPSQAIDGGTAGTGTFRVVNSDPNTATSAAPLSIIYAVSNVEYEDKARNIVSQSFQPRLISQNGLGGYTFRFGASFESNTPALHAFKRAMNEWSCKTFINWVTASNSPIATTADDDVNAVRFASSGDLPANVLGRTISRYRGCIQGTVVNFWVDEIDMEFAQRSDWQYGPNVATNTQYDFQSVVVHELGHGHQLSHLILPRAVMHYAVSRGQSSRTLNPENDIAGGNYVMALSATAPPCNVAKMVPKPANACAIPVEQLKLTGEFSNNQVILKWTTETETGLTEFAVERSEDGITYTQIGTVPASGNSTSPRSYQFIDPNPFPALTYYRLRLIRTNGTLEYSEVVQVTGPSFVRQLAPNPGGRKTFLYFNTTEADNVKLTIYDLTGRIFGVVSVNVVPQSNRYELTLPLAGQGLYLIMWQSKRESGTIRYVKIDKQD